MKILVLACNTLIEHTDWNVLRTLKFHHTKEHVTTKQDFTINPPSFFLLSEYLHYYYMNSFIQELSMNRTHVVTSNSLTEFQNNVYLI